MTEIDTTTLDELVLRLETRRRSSCAAATSRTDAAAGLVEDCAALAGEASAELERLARASASEPLPGQDSLL